MVEILWRGGRRGRPSSDDERTGPESTAIIDPPGSSVEGYRVAVAKEQVVLEIGGREVVVTNPSKVYFPDAGYTKGDVVRYYQAVADGALAGIRAARWPSSASSTGSPRSRSSRSAPRTTRPSGWRPPS